MANTGCKWIAIIGIVVGCVVGMCISFPYKLGIDVSNDFCTGLWLVSSLVRCFVCGAGFKSSFFCLCAPCCSCCKPKKKKSKNQGYKNSGLLHGSKTTHPPSKKKPPAYGPSTIHTYYHVQKGTKNTPKPAKKGQSSVSVVVHEHPVAPAQAAGGGFFGYSEGGYKQLDDADLEYNGYEQHDNSIHMSEYPMGESNYNEYSVAPAHDPFQDPQNTYR